MKEHRFFESVVTQLLDSVNERPNGDIMNPVKKEAMESNTKTVDYTKICEDTYSIRYDYEDLQMMNISRFAVTNLCKELKEYDLVISDSVYTTQPPSTNTIRIDYGVTAKVFEDVMLYSSLGVISGVYIKAQGIYRIEILGKNRECFEQLNSLYLLYLQNSNFYIGKCLKLMDDGTFDFMPLPNKTFEDVVLSNGTMDEYRNTAVDFLLNPRMQEICKKRRVILYGPPGTGKTSLISATFNYLSSNNITCISLNEVGSLRGGLERTFNFIFKYLSPAFLVFEDIDLIGSDRNSGNSRLIGQLLSIFDGVEEVNKALVFCSTTNAFESLDRAFIRPCRIDRRYLLDYMTDKEMNTLFKKLLNVDLPKILSGQKLTGAHIQEISDTARLLASKADDKDVKKYIDEAINIVMEHFCITKGKAVGFSIGEDDCRLNGISKLNMNRDEGMSAKDLIKEKR